MLAVCFTEHVESPDERWEFRPLEVPMFAGSSDTDFHPWTSDSLCTVFSVDVGSPGIYVGTSDVDLNGWIFTWSINTPLFTSNRYGLISQLTHFVLNSSQATKAPLSFLLCSNLRFP